jgi:hypothetical protein
MAAAIAPRSDHVAYPLKIELLSNPPSRNVPNARRNPAIVPDAVMILLAHSLERILAQILSRIAFLILQEIDQMTTLMVSQII